MRWEGETIFAGRDLISAIQAYQKAVNRSYNAGLWSELARIQT